MHDDPKIVRWGIRRGAENLKNGKHFPATQFGCGGSNSATKNKKERRYSNAKLDRISKVISVFKKVKGRI